MLHALCSELVVLTDVDLSRRLHCSLLGLILPLLHLPLQEPGRQMGEHWRRGGEGKGGEGQGLEVVPTCCVCEAASLVQPTCLPPH